MKSRSTGLATAALIMAASVLQVPGFSDVLTRRQWPERDSGWRHDPARIAAAEAKRRRKALALNKAREPQS